MKGASIFTGIFFVLASGFSAAESSSTINYVEGKDYVVLSEPHRTANPSKIEVVEAFAYPCRACFSFEPILERWVKSQPEDVAFIRTHVTFRPEWVPYQRGYYTVLSLKLDKNIDVDIFNEIHVKHKELNTAQAWADFLANYGVDKERVINTYDSFGVSSQMKQADARSNGFKIGSTPMLVINGKYKVNNERKFEEVIKIAQFLVEKVRAEKAPKTE